MKLLFSLLLTLSFNWFGNASPIRSEFNQQIFFQKPNLNFTPWNIVTHAAFPNLSLRYKQPDICETTEGVNQYSGYLDIDKDKHFFFWFFESRNDPSTDPTILWLNGGPGCSSLTGLLMELGPCRVAKTGNDTILNEFSWNNQANLIFLDQPVNVGYSYSNGGSVKDTLSAGKDVYSFLQLLFKKFPQYNRNIHVFGESYAGHYIPVIGYEIFTHNKELEDGDDDDNNHDKDGDDDNDDDDDNDNDGDDDDDNDDDDDDNWMKNLSVKAKKELVKIDLASLGIGNGMVDPFIQYNYYSEMACGSESGPLLSKEECLKMHDKEKTCRRLIASCYEWENPFVCVPASMYCNNALISPYQKTGRNVYDIRTKCENNNLCYAIMDDIETYLNRDDIKKAVGADESIKYKSCNLQINMDFQSTGDWMRPFVKYLPDLLDAGLRILIYAGDADFICNWLGNKAWTEELEWEGKLNFNFALDKEWYGYDSKESLGEVRSYENFSFLRIYEAGHMVPYDQPEASANMIKAWINDEMSQQTKRPVSIPEEKEENKN